VLALVAGATADAQVVVALAAYSLVREVVDVEPCAGATPCATVSGEKECALTAFLRPIRTQISVALANSAF